MKQPEGTKISVASVEKREQYIVTIDGVLIRLTGDSGGADSDWDWDIEIGVEVDANLKSKGFHPGRYYTNWGKVWEWRNIPGDWDEPRLIEQILNAAN